MKLLAQEHNEAFVLDLMAEDMKDMALLVRLGKMRKEKPRIWVTVFDNGTCNMHVRFDKNKRSNGDIKRE